MESQFPDAATIQETHALIKPYIHRTPVMSSRQLNRMAGAELYFKCENFQKVGAFKMRGATNAVLRLSDAEAERGVATHSSGNHAAALALAARNRGIRAYIVMPKTAPEIKKKAVAGYGAEIIFCEPTLQAREETLQQVVERTGATFIHPYNNWRVIAGQATAALEMLQEIPDLDVLLAPVGGGGLLSGTALAARWFSPKTEVYGAEPAGADDACRSLQAGRIIPSINPNTIADGLLTSLGPKTFAVISRQVREILTVDDGQIVEAMRGIWERMKIVVESSAAVPLAVAFQYRQRFSGKKVGIILSGGNVDLSRLPF
ncbi:MAG: pyridoxal-phosphate dependent enzyme [Calditrichia bacterium]